MIDLHCHSHFSDGLLSPVQLIRKAQENQIQILALTDHDSVHGVEAITKAAQTSAIQIITGIELSALWAEHEIHIIGLNFDPTAPEIQDCIQQQSDYRRQRGQQISDKLSNLGMHKAFAKACDLAGHDRIGRAHLARVMVQESWVPDITKAFKRYLGRGKAAYVRPNWISLEEAIKVITRARGMAVLAHPHKYKLTSTKLKALLKAFKERGGVGMEVVSGDMPMNQISYLQQLSLDYELLASSGSDYHGEDASRISLGKQQPLPFNCVPIWHQWQSKGF